MPDEGLLSAVAEGSVNASLQLKSLQDFIPEQWGLPAYDEACYGYVKHISYT